MAAEITIIVDGIDINDSPINTLQEQMLCEQFLEFLRKSDSLKLNQLREAMDTINPNLNPVS